MQSATGFHHPEYEALKRDLETELAPATTLERTFAGLVVHATWRIQCCDRIEARLDPASDPETADQRQAQLDRTRAQATNNLRKALQDLRLLQTERRLRVELFQGAPVTANHGLASYKEIVATLAKDTYRRAAAAGRSPTIEDFRNLLNKTNPTVSQENSHQTATKPEITNRTQPTQEAVPQVNRNIGRNAPCPCHSGQKFKRCCGRHAPAPFSNVRAQAA